MIFMIGKFTKMATTYQLACTSELFLILFLCSALGDATIKQSKRSEMQQLGRHPSFRNTTSLRCSWCIRKFIDAETLGGQ